MIYPQNFEQKIGFDQIRNILKKNCSSTLGINKVDEMIFRNKFEDITKLLDLNNEFLKIITGEEVFPECHFYDLRSAIKRLKIEGTWIYEEDMIKLKKSLKSILDLVSFFRQEDGSEEIKYPNLNKLSQEIDTFPNVIKDINRILDDNGEIRDNASPELASIRREKYSTLSCLSKKLNSIMKKAKNNGYVEKDLNPSMREGRLVIPVSPTYKRKINGIVHDESATGKTVFIEPAELVESNNRIRELENEEKREIVKILTLFSNGIRSFAPQIARSYDFLAEIDFLYAKSKFAKEINAIRPVFEDKPQIKWLKAIHPLLFLSLKEQHKMVVPLNVCVDEKDRILIISGPNAGGKSVCLKTVGLLQYMLQNGLMIPVSPDSETGWFKDVFIDIGDEQSIENDLSTYSSHLLNMKNFLKFSNNKSLILIDEFGSGTEPKIGGAIAETCLDYYNKHKSFGIITTHYSNLKHYAEGHEGIKNGAMLYDRHEMKPLFKLEIGHPGSSFAIDIARKIGLPNQVIQRASDIVGTSYINMDKYLQDIVRDKQYWENKRKNIHKQEKNLDDISEKLKVELEDVNKKRKEILKQAKEEASNLLHETNAKIENTIRSIKEAQAKKDETKIIRKNFNTFKEEVEKENTFSQEYLEKKISKIKRREIRKKEKLLNKNKEPIPKIKPKNKPFEIKDSVKIKGQNSKGVILSINGKKACVAFGTLKMNVKIENLVHTDSPTRAINKYSNLGIISTDQIQKTTLNFRRELDVRGKRGEEALEIVQHYIDDAIVTSADKVRILHGTGTGILKTLICKYLKTVPNISTFYDEQVQFGGAGITIVEFK